MKCPHCQSEWTIRLDGANPMTNCPFCGQSLQPAPKTDSLEGCLRQIYGQFGIDPFRNGKALVGLHSDLCPDRQRDRRLLAILLLCESHTALLEILKKPKGEQSVALTRLAKKMEGDWMIKPEAIREVCSAFWLAVGGDKEALNGIAEQKTAPAVSAPAPAPKPAKAKNSTPASRKPASRKPAGAVCQPADFQQTKGVLTRYTGQASIVAVPDGIHTIGKGAFKDTSVREVWLPEGVESIEEDGFCYCTSLRKIILPQSLLRIGSNVFYHCDALTEVTIPPNVTEIGNYAFMSCINLKQVSIPNSVKSIGSFAFSFSSRMERFQFPGSVVELKEYMFSNCKKMHTVEIGQGVRCIKYNVFSECTALKTVVIPDSVTTVDPKAFAGCQGITIVASDSWKRAHRDIMARIP